MRKGRERESEEEIRAHVHAHSSERSVFQCTVLHVCMDYSVYYTRMRMYLTFECLDIRACVCVVYSRTMTEVFKPSQAQRALLFH